jgi:hypothetical protein
MEIKLPPFAGGSKASKNGAYGKSNRCSTEVRGALVRMAFEHEREYANQSAKIITIYSQKRVLNLFWLGQTGFTYCQAVLKTQLSATSVGAIFR